MVALAATSLAWHSGLVAATAAASQRLADPRVRAALAVLGGVLLVTWSVVG